MIMNRKKSVLAAVVCVAAVVTVVLMCGYVRHYTGEEAGYRKIAEELYNFEQALKKEDARWEMDSVSIVTPYTYMAGDGSTIVYYLCNTSYPGNEIPNYTGLNSDALEQIIDFADIENRRACKVNGLEAFQCEIGERTYLCWTITPAVSCVLEYTAGCVSEEDIIEMAESVQLPDNIE